MRGWNAILLIEEEALDIAFEEGNLREICGMREAGARIGLDRTDDFVACQAYALAESAGATEQRYSPEGRAEACRAFGRPELPGKGAQDAINENVRWSAWLNDDGHVSRSTRRRRLDGHLDVLTQHIQKFHQPAD